MLGLDDLRRHLESSPEAALPGIEYFGADLRRANLAGIQLACYSLRGVNLDGADLSGARLVHVDLSGASLRRANLEQAHLEHVSVRSAVMAEARCARSTWVQVDASAADLTRADLRDALVRAALLERTNFAGADLSLVRLLNCTCTDAAFSSACLEQANTAGTDFTGATFDGARRFYASREIVAELLAREVHDDFERAKLVGAIAIGRRWCYPEWAGFLDLHPDYRQVAIDVFRRYPQSGFVEALRGRWAAGTRPPPEPAEAGRQRTALAP